MTRDEIKSAVMEAMAEHGASCGRCCDTCELSTNEHRDHHQALRGAFSVRSQVIAVVVKLAAGGGAVWVGLAMWEYFKLKTGK